MKVWITVKSRTGFCVLLQSLAGGPAVASDVALKASARRLNSLPDSVQGCAFAAIADIRVRLTERQERNRSSSAEQHRAFLRRTAQEGKLIAIFVLSVS